MLSEEKLIEFTKDTSKCTWKHGTTDPSPHNKVPFDPQPKKIMDDILDAIGYTPLIRLNKIPQSEGVKCEILVKCEFFSAGGSTKDRIGKRMVLEAERTGRIKKGDTLIEPTSGNTGIGLALSAIVKGYKMIVTLPDKMSNEKVDILKGLGSEVIRTPTEAPMDSEESYVGLAKKLQRELPNAHLLDQYKNADNPLAHYDETAEEILFQTDSKLDVIVLSAGTGGTVTGIGRKIKEKTPNVKILAVDPVGSILALPKELNCKGLGSYKVEGPGQSHIPVTLCRSHVDEWVKTDDEESFIMTRRLISEEGLLAGGTSGAVVSGAIKYAKKHNLPEGTRMVVVLPDGVRSYLTKLLSKDWMIVNKFLPLSEYDDPKHKLHGLGFEKLNLSPVKYYDGTLTIGQALADFKKGAPAVAIVNNKKVERIVVEQKLLEAISNKGLSGGDLASKGSTKEFAAVPSSVTLTQLQKILERYPVVFVEHYDANGDLVLYAPTVRDIIDLMI